VTTAEQKKNSDLAVRTISGLALIAVALAAIWIGGWAFILLVLLCGGLMAREWLALTRRGPLLLRVLGIPYVLLPVLGLLALRGQENGFALVLWVMLVTWSTDIFAYFAGRSIGGAKLAPRISPGKTWSGLAGGVAAAGIIGWLAAMQLNLASPFPYVGAVMAIAAQCGDLFESWLKRRAGVKDSGYLIPGHGGILDRLDGLVPVSVLTALILVAQIWMG
jgi:phosphatidate cytidylyltransferase